MRRTIKSSIQTAGEFVSMTFELTCAVVLLFFLISLYQLLYIRHFQCLKLFYTKKDQSLCKAILFRPHYIKSLRKFKDF